MASTSSQTSVKGWVRTTARIFAPGIALTFVLQHASDITHFVSGVAPVFTGGN